MEPTIQQLKKAAKEINEETGIETTIDTEADREELIKQIRDVSWAILPEDEVSEQTMEVVRALGYLEF